MKHECPDCGGRGCHDDPNLPIDAMPPLCQRCKGKGTVPRKRRYTSSNWAPREVRMSPEHVLLFEPAPFVERTAGSLTEAELCEIERRHGWRVRR